MSDLQELEGRISAALERVSRGIEGLAQVPDVPEIDEEALARLTEELDAERIANAQLEERVRVLHARGQDQDGAADAEAQVAQLQLVIDQLRAANSALRAANAEGLGDAGAINAGLEAELAALRAQRDSDRAELNGLIAELEPLTEEKAHA